MRSLTIDIEKRTDGDSVMRCTRDDGSGTWQRHTGPRAVFFVYHDLTHLAVESVLGETDGFFGLIARGWDVQDTEGRNARGPLPPRALAIENLVGLFDRERASGATWSAAEFNDAAALYASAHGHAAPAEIAAGDITTIRARVSALHEAWRATPPGGTLRLLFPDRGGGGRRGVSASSRGSSRDR